MAVKASITKHTTASLPRPHVLYVVDVVPEDGQAYSVVKRYSDFVDLHKTIGDAFIFPPKRILTTTFIPSAWVDDKLIAEREAGLTAYLSNLLAVQAYAEHPAVVDFLAPSPAAAKASRFDAEDALPSTLSRKDAAALSEDDDEVNAEASFIAASYYPYWAVDSNPPENIDFSKFDILFFAFATPSSSNGVSFDGGATNTLRRLVTAANKSGKGTKIVLSVGGWGGCQYFHQAMSSSANRGVFIAALANTVNTYGLAGIDIDWEYPNDPGAGQPYGSADSANLLTFFTYLRKSLGSSKIISAAVTQQPWKGSNSNPLTDVSAYAAQMNYVNIMNYDVWGSSSTPGPNAPLSNACNTSSQPQASAQAALNAWTKAKFPANKLLLGLPTYGYVSKSKKTVLTGAFALPGPPADAPVTEHTERVRALAASELQDTITVDNGAVAEPVEEQPLNDLGGAHDVEAMRKMMARRVNPDTVEAAATGDLSAYFGQQIAFNQIVALGALKKSGSVYVQNNGYTQAWDDCSDTPFLFNASRQTVVTYDDTYSLADKAALAKKNNMAGCFTWSLDQDDGYTLQNVIRKSLGKS